MAATISASSTTVRCASISFSKVSLRSNNAVSVSFGGFRQQTSKRGLRITCEAAKPDTVEKVIQIVTKQLAVAEGSVKPHSKFQELGADSLDQVEIVMALEEEFKISVDENGAESIVTVEDAAKLIEETLAKA